MYLKYDRDEWNCMHFPYYKFTKAVARSPAMTCDPPHKSSRQTHDTFQLEDGTGTGVRHRPAGYAIDTWWAVQDIWENDAIDEYR